jgi:hypothetical protein
MNQYAALEIKAGETAHQVVEAFMRTSVAKGQMFTKLDLLGVLKLGSTKYVRISTDAPNIFVLDDRKTIGFKNGDYSVHDPIKGTTSGKISGSSMQMTSDPSIHREYRGPKLKYWERQFL